MIIDLPFTPARDPRLIAVTPTTTTMDATTIRLSQVFRVTKAGTIKYVRFFPTITSAGNLTVSLMTVTTNMVPTTSNFAANTFVTMTPTNNVWNLATMTGNAVVNVGDLIAIQFQWSGTAGSINFASQTTYSPTIMQTQVGSTWTKQSNQWLSLGVGYSDGSWPPDISISVRGNATSVPVSTSTGEYATRWTPNKNYRLSGLLYYGYLAADASFLVYNSALSVLLTQTNPANFVSDATDRLFHIVFPTSIQLAANNTYRLSILPASANTSRFYNYATDSTTTESLGYGSGLYSYSGRSIGNLWTDPLDTFTSFIPVYNGISYSNYSGWTGGFND